MNFADNPLIRRTLAPQPSPDPYAEPRDRLWRALLQFRERAATLANEIHRDLPDFTVHDITHLDALWEMADLIAGPDYPLNPPEAFALGAVFLLHDLGLGLAAWPGGVDELKNGPGWQDALSTYLRKHLERIPTAEELASPPPEVERMAVQERLRVLHAEHAERLALASFPKKPKEGAAVYHLIEDPDLRQAIGPLLGKIAHSHWWPVSRLGNEFCTVRGALTQCPGDWTLDPLKIAVLLRTADAAHLDARRAPGFLTALRRPEGTSEKHWRFQNHLLKPRVEDDRLAYTTASPFLTEEVDAWWLCEETLRMVDREFHQVDALLADLKRTPRLRVYGVAGVESPNRLQKYVEVSGWTPVDARLHVSNVADLARRLGGEQLYGNDQTVPLRELIQNASDAVRARRVLENRPSDWGRVTVRLGRDEQGPWVEVEDMGIGMSEAVLTGPLLDFGTTYWGSALMREEHEGLWATGFEPTGRFGIGFFSVFMWGHRVSIATRRYDDSPRATRILEFRTGCDIRPLIRLAQPGEQLRDGGTQVRIWLSKDPGEAGGLLWNKWFSGGSDKKQLDLGDLCTWLSPALDVDLYAQNEKEIRRVVGASDWLTLDGVQLLARLSLAQLEPTVQAYAPCVRPIIDSEGRILGRAAIVDFLSFTHSNGAVTVGGFRTSGLDGVAGIVVGGTSKISRDTAFPLTGAGSLRVWASEQAAIIAKEILDADLQVSCATYILSYGGDPGGLPIAKGGGRYFDRHSIERWKDSPIEICLLYRMGENDGVDLYAHVLVCDNIFPFYSSFESPYARYPHDVFRESLAQAWESTPDDIEVTGEFTDYEIGKNKDGHPVKAMGFRVFRKPLR